MERLCANAKCKIGWRPIEIFNGRSRCPACLAEYQRDYWNRNSADERQRLHPTTAKSALDDLEKAWPERVTKFEDCGTWDYETNTWHPTKFNYDELN